MGRPSLVDVLSPDDLRAWYGVEQSVGNRAAAYASEDFLLAHATNRTRSRPTTMLFAGQVTNATNTTSATTGSLWSEVDQALFYNGLFVIVLCLLAYATLRMLMCCAPRLRDRVLRPRPLASGEKLLYWWNLAFWWPDNKHSMSEHDSENDVMQARAGVEAAMLMRYASFLIRLLVISSLIALPLLLPIYGTAGPIAETGLSTLSILHVERGSWRLGMSAVVAVIITFLHINMTSREWKAFARKRHAWLRSDSGAYQAAVVVQCYGEGAAILGPLEVARLLESALQGHKVRACAELPSSKPGDLLMGAFSRPRDLPPPVDPDELLEVSSKPDYDTWVERHWTSYTKHFLVLFDSRAAASICVESGAQLLGLELEARVVPLERHMYWAGLLYTPTGLFNIAAWAVIIGIFLFFGAIVAVIQGLAQLSVISTYSGFTWIAAYKGTLGWILVEQVAPSLVLSVSTYAVLKTGLFQVLQRLQAPLTHAEIQARTCSLVMAFYMVVILIASVFAGGLYESLSTEVHKDGLLSIGSSMLRFLSGGLPEQNSFWLHYIISDVMVLNLEILLVAPLGIELLQRIAQCCRTPEPGAKRWVDAELSPDYNGIITFAYARSFFLAAIGIMFAAVAPCVLFGSLGYLLIFQPLWARNLAEAYSSPRSDTGGRIWIQAMRFTAYAVALSSLTLCGVLADRGCTAGAIVVGCLPLITLYYEWWTRVWYRDMAMRLSVLHCTELDEASPIDVVAPDKREPEAAQLFAALLAYQRRQEAEALSKMSPSEWIRRPMPMAPSEHVVDTRGD